MRVHRENDRRKLLLLVVDCIERASKSSWWDWDEGSRPFLWGWRSEYHNNIRDRHPMWYRGPAPYSFLSQKKEKDPDVSSSMGSNLLKVFARCNFIYGIILSLTSFLLFQRGH
jgi:hypothetical protein